jgi:hypothetical protein
MTHRAGGASVVAGAGAEVDVLVLGAAVVAGGGGWVNVLVYGTVVVADTGAWVVADTSGTDASVGDGEVGFDD